MSQKTYLNILKGGVYASFLTLFLVFNNLLFPYITSKQIPFNILIEVLTVVWLAFIVKFPAFRPKKNYITFGLLAFFAVLIVSSFAGVDFNLSFWGDIERMLGVFPLLHFLALYFIIITVMRRQEDWHALLMVSVGAATLETFYVIFKNPYGTLGNTSYISGQMIFNIFFALILFFRQKNLALRWFYGVSIFLMLDAMRLAGTRGAFVGLALSILLLFFLLAVLNKNKKLRIVSLSASAVFVILVGLVFANADKAFVKNSRLLGRITQIDFQTATFQTRLISWRAAIKDFPNHPLLGTGYGNFAITFDKFFDPTFYNYTASETYFDHAHNNLLDILTTTGALGLLAYLSIFLAIFYYLIQGYRQGRIGQMDFILLVCLIVAYFIQNVVLFDSFVTYLLLMVMLGFIYWLSHEENTLERIGETVRVLFRSEQAQNNKEVSVFLVAGLAMLVIIYQFSYKPWQMLVGTIAGQVAMARERDLVLAVNEYKQALSHKTVLDRDSRSSLIQLVLQQDGALANLEAAKRNEILDYAISLAEKNLEYNQHDSYNLMLLTELLHQTANLNSADRQKFTAYSKRAEEAINRTIEATPRRVPVYFIKAQILFARGDKAGGMKVLQYAVDLNPKYPESHCQLSRVYFFDKNEKAGFEEVEKCIELGGGASLDINMLGQLANKYLIKKDYVRTVKVLERMAAVQPNDAKIWASLAEAYKQTGNKAAAKAAAQKAAQLEPDMKAGAEQFIRSLEE